MMNKQAEDKSKMNLEKSDQPIHAERGESPLSVDSLDSSTKVKPMSEKKKRKLEMSEEELRNQRRAANRRSAFESRQRRKVLIEELQDTVQNLSKENAAVRKEADNYKAQVETLQRENRQLRLQQQLVNSRLQLQGGIPEHNSQQLRTRGTNLWGLQQGIGNNIDMGGLHQGRNVDMGMPFAGLDQFLGSSSQNVAQLGSQITRGLQAPTVDSMLTEQAREYLRALQERKDGSR